MIYNFDFNIEKDGQPYVTGDKASKFLSDLLYSRVSDKPILETRIAKSLLETGQVDLNQEDSQHLLNIILTGSYDNYFKIALAEPLLVDEIDGVPVSVTLWQLRDAMDNKKLVDYHPVEVAAAIGMALGLTEEQATTYTIRQYVSYLINIMPSSTPEQIAAKSRAFNAFEYANTILRSSPTVSQIAGILQLTKEQVDQLYISAKLVEA